METMILELRIISNSQLWPLDYEDYSSYEIIIGTGSGNNVTRSIIVTITDQNERPAIVDDRHGHVAENSVDPYIVHSNSSLGRIDLASPFVVNDPDFVHPIYLHHFERAGKLENWWCKPKHPQYCVYDISLRRRHLPESH